MSRTVKLVFLGSLVLNLLLVGVLLGQLPGGLGATVPTRQERLEQALTKVPEPTRSSFRQKFSEIRAAGDPVRRELDGARAQALDMLSAERFDESGYDRQISRIEELRAELFKRMAVKIKQTAKELSPEERRMFADVLRRPSPPPQ